MTWYSKCTKREKREGKSDKTKVLYIVTLYGKYVRAYAPLLRAPATAGASALGSGLAPLEIYISLFLYLSFLPVMATLYQSHVPPIYIECVLCIVFVSK